MPRRPNATHRWLTAVTWPVGVLLTSWDYLWRITPMHRRESISRSPVEPFALPYPAEIDAADLQGPDQGRGPLFHRRYRTWVRDARLSPDELMTRVQRNLNQAAPTTFARFQKVFGDKGRMDRGDEYVVRMPGPWDGPVRVIAVEPCGFRLATLQGHLEAGQIEFRARPGDRTGDDGSRELCIEIESWARSSGWLSNLLYHRLKMSKEVQAHMWISFLERSAKLSGGRMVGGITIETERLEVVTDGR